MQIVAFSSTGSNKIHALKRMFSPLQEHLSKVFVLYVTCFDHNYHIIRGKEKFKRKVNSGI